MKKRSGFFNNLSKDLKNDFTNSHGFSSRNLRYLKKFYDFYKNDILHQVGAELPSEKEIADKIGSFEK